MGYDEGGQLTEAVRRKPYSVVLFDEVGKPTRMCSMSCFRCWTTDGLPIPQGRTVDFKNTIIIMTSTRDPAYLLDGIDENGNIKPGGRGGGHERSARILPTGVLNRLDEDHHLCR